MVDKHKIAQIKPVTDAVSPTFCLAKWHHTTIYLQTGETHSCYHPAPHAIPLYGLAENPSMLHNTPQKKLERKQMLEGKKPSGCQYCWKIEKLGPSYISDRHIRNASIYTADRLTDITAKTWEYDISPEYVEVSFGNECQMSCIYCHPKASSAWAKEISQHGLYLSSSEHQQFVPANIKKEETNPYVDAFWAWWPTIAPTLNILRITGGEPLLHTSMWKLLDYIDQHPQPHLELNINSNLSIKPALVDRLITKYNLLKQQDKIKWFELYTSLDTWGPKAAYIRNGLDLDLWEQNFDRFLRGAWVPVSFMITVNAMSISSFKSLLIKILEWRAVYNSKDHTKRQRVKFDTPHLKEPVLFDMRILPKVEYLPYLEDCMAFIEANCEDGNNRKFSNIELEKIRRIVDYMRNTALNDADLFTARKNFYNWISEHDKRYSKSFISTFPEMQNFWDICKDAAKHD